MPVAVLAGHGVVHVLFVVLAGVAADWAMQQQVQRIQVNEHASTALSPEMHSLHHKAVHTQDIGSFLAAS